MTNIIGGANLVLRDSDASGCIKDNNTRPISYYANGKYISIGIVGDYQLIGAPFCTGVSITKLNEGWLKLFLESSSRS